jgi:two-component system chemotaxis response regulator CheB
LDRSGPLPADFPDGGEIVEGGRIYVAPPGRHLLIASGEVRLSNGPRVNRHRPSIDIMFASVANWAYQHCIAVVLSGVLDDGAVGAAMVARAGGLVFAQDPSEAGFPGMPEAALAAAPGTRPLARGDLAESIHTALGDVSMAHARAVGQVAGPEALMSMADSDNPAFLADEETRLTRITCPECGGAMAQVDLPQISYFRCHVGHQYAPQTLAAAQAEASEAKLWGAVAALEEQAAVQRYLGKVSADNGNGDLMLDQDRHAGEIAARAVALRDQVRRWTAERDPIQRPA